MQNPAPKKRMGAGKGSKQTSCGKLFLFPFIEKETQEDYFIILKLNSKVVLRAE